MRWTSPNLVVFD